MKKITLTNMPETRVGLCANCIHAKRVAHPRDGQDYWLCAYSETDAHFPRYPRLPVLNCAAYLGKNNG